MRKEIVIGTAVVAILFVAALIGDGVRRNVSDDAPLTAPQPNPHPTQRIKLYVTFPPSLEVRLGVEYSVGTWLGMFGGGGGVYCGPYSNRMSQAGDPPPARITVPIALTWDGSAYEGEFSPDGYLPGPCHWGFSGLDILSPTKDFIFLKDVKYNFSADKDDAYYQQPFQGIDLWCGADPNGVPSQHGKMICTSLGYFAAFPGAVAAKLLAYVRVEDHTNVSPYRETITLRFHDLAAEDRAATAAH